MFLKIVNNIARRRIVNRPPVSLGRWEHRVNEKQQDLKILWANIDHCGDIICGKPENIKIVSDNSKKSR